MIPLRKSTASQEVLLGPFLDDTDGKTAETALTIANTDIKLWKRGGTSESNKNSGGATHIASGRYYAVLDATDTDTTGELIINVAVAGALPVRLVCCVFEAAVFDAVFASGAAGYQVPIWSSASATVNLSATTIKAVTDAVALPASASINITGNITGNLSGSVGSVTGAVGSVTGNVGGSVASVTGAVGSVTGNVGGSVASVVGNVGGNVTGSVGSVLSAVTAGTVTDKTGYSLVATTGLGNQTANITGNLSGSVGSVTGSVGSVTAAVTAGTVTDKTGYSLLATTGLGNQTANITGNLSGSVGSVTGAVGSVTAAVTVGTNNDKTGYSLTQSFPANFASLVISAGGVASANVVQWNGGSLPTIGTSMLTAADVWTYSSGRTVTNTIPTATDNAAAVWGASLTTYAAAGTFGGQVLRSQNTTNEVKVVGAGHVAADIHELQAGVITAADFAAGAIDAAALAADAASEIAAATASALATTTSNVAAIKAKTDNLPAAPAATGDIPTAVQVADAVLGRSVATVQATAGEHSLTTVILAALESNTVDSPGNLRIYRTDGTTVYQTRPLTSDANAEPITGIS